MSLRCPCQPPCRNWRLCPEIKCFRCHNSGHTTKDCKVPTKAAGAIATARKHTQFTRQPPQSPRQFPATLPQDVHRPSPQPQAAATEAPESSQTSWETRSITEHAVAGLPPHWSLTWRPDTECAHCMRLSKVIAEAMTVLYIHATSQHGYHPPSSQQ